MTQQSDHNLLFGILAVQMDFVTRDSLLNAMHAWLLRKHDSLGQLLVRQGDLSVANERLLQQVVDAHLAVHESDMRQSLAASIRMTDLAGALRDLNDEDLRHSLANLSGGNAAALNSTPIGELASLDGRFVVVRPHASGGLGEVSVAIDRELNREVALKRVREQLVDSPEACSRFRMEAEVTGSLEHPGIVPVYSLGSTEEGRPFYAMRFIRGETMHHAIRRYHGMSADETETRKTAFRDLLRRFIDVGDAVGYAHSRGVLHRDLKPDNIMLGNFGETLVVDWGLARVRGQSFDSSNSTGSLLPLQVASGSESPATLHGRVMGTLQYMSPEQAEGKSDEVAPATDVYSMGAILYEILTGNPPVEKVIGPDGSPDITATLHKICEGIIRPASTVNAAVSSALSAVCEKAMALRPQDRYASISELTKDVERWMADEPVSVIRESVSQRLVRWGRRHQTLTVSMAAMLSVTAAGLTVFGAIVSTKNSELSHLNGQLDSSNVFLTLSNEREQQARVAAQNSEMVARDQSQLALSTLTSVVNDIQDGLRNVSGSGEVRKNLLRTALQKLEQVAMSHVESSQVDRSAMTIFLDIGDAVRRFGTDEKFADDPAANPSSDSAVTESLAQMARRYYQRAYEIAKDRADQPNADRHARADLAVTLNKLANAELLLGHPAKAMEWVQQGIAVSKALADESPEDTDAKVQVCTWLCQAGDIFLLNGDLDKAGESFRSALATVEPLTSSQPDNEQFSRALSVALGRLGNVELLSSRLNEALMYYERDLQIAQALCDASPNDTSRRRDVAVSWGKCGDVHYRAGHLTESLTAYREAARFSEELLAREPNDMLQMRDTAVILNRMGDVLSQSNNIKESLELYQRGYELSRKIADSSGQDAAAQRDLAISLDHLGDSHLSLGDADAALKSFAESHTIRSHFAALDTSSQAQTDLLVSLYKLGSVYQHQKNWQDAINNYRSAVEILKTLDAAGQLPPVQKTWITEIEQAIRMCESQ